MSACPVIVVMVQAACAIGCAKPHKEQAGADLRQPCPSGLAI